MINNQEHSQRDRAGLPFQFRRGPGEYVSAQLVIVGVCRNVLMVPASALMPDANGDYVSVVNAQTSLSGSTSNKLQAKAAIRDQQGYLDEA